MINRIKRNTLNNSDIVEYKEENHYHYETEEFKEDLGIIQDIFNNILEYPKGNAKRRKNVVIDVSEKISINFKEVEGIKKLLLDAYLNISIIEELFQSLDNYDQNTITADIYAKYLELKFEGYPKEKILFDLCKQYVPKGMERNPEYKSMSRSLVLFFFEDCTWGDKTEEEKRLELKK